MLADEAWFHRRRGLPRWERIGHPLDTLTIALCLAWLLVTRPEDPWALSVYVGLAIFSTLFVTKDEWVHAKSCSAGEQWLHSILFVLHPVVLAAFAVTWWSGHDGLLVGQLVVTLSFLGYQIVYWNVIVPRAQRRPAVNNDWYADLGARWYTAEDTPIALLRAESRHRNPWIAGEIAERASPCAAVLDLGCGAGFLSNYLGGRGHRVTGLDTTAENLAVAKHYDRSGRVSYQLGDACALPFADRSFDVVCAMDLLEHVEEPSRLIAEASRVLAPSGLFFFHTFNRNWLSKLIVIKGVEWFVKNTPKDLHVLRLFLTPDEVRSMLRDHGLELVELRGSRPRFRWPMWRMLLTGKVGDGFAFTFTDSTRLGFTGYARKTARRIGSRHDDLASMLRSTPGAGRKEPDRGEAASSTCARYPRHVACTARRERELVKAKQLQANGATTWVLVFDPGDEVISELQHFASAEHLSASTFSAIGAFQDVVLGYFDWKTKDYEKIPVAEQVEVVSLNGFITESDDGPRVHAHVALGRRDGTALGGHLLEGHVRPTLELVLTESPRALRRTQDAETGLPLIDLAEARAG
jgi:2-polyprenyl-6-hydroxyphenyl methylase / 3-demethylubiquinone-9 3-methyltransferase